MVIKDENVKTTEVHLPEWMYSKVALAVMVVVLIAGFIWMTPGLNTAVFGTSVKTGADPPSGDAVNLAAITTATSTPHPTPSATEGAATPTGQETTSATGIPVSVVRVEFYEAEEWKLNTLYIDPQNPGKGVLLVRMKDIEYLQPFRIANAEYSNFRLEKYKNDLYGTIADLKVNAVTSQGNVGVHLFVIVFDKLPQKDQTGAIVNGAIGLDSTNGGFTNLPPSNSVLKIEITQA